MWYHRVRELWGGTVSRAAFMNPKTAATAHAEKRLSGTSVKLTILRAPAFLLRYHFTLQFFLVEYFSETSLRRLY